jgi:hypothetical protein
MSETDSMLTVTRDTEDRRSQGAADVLHLCYLAELLRGEREGWPPGGGGLPAGRRLVSR